MGQSKLSVYLTRNYSIYLIHPDGETLLAYGDTLTLAQHMLDLDYSPHTSAENTLPKRLHI